MTEHDSTASAAEHDPFEQYRYIEYTMDDESVSVIQDTENDRAWIQSTHAVLASR
ncbi:hypothetical protein C477_22050 [Haloterrigena salina JCM 13891]|uniref:Uncharacterized protein n=1 Tax=Haloterrigena salina JCM 13891 TaxID=1227488 RepID=M0BQF6_9EURY|nr:hypothetical protein [Haloterrigena salina]ELZ13186.1 hypothetical protein C477_22050 [Haloterrigena salina JCM 13891]